MYCLGRSCTESQNQHLKMADDLQKEDELDFTIDFMGLKPLEELDQAKLDELKYIEVPDDVWRAIKHDLETLPPLQPVVQKSAENQQTTSDKGKRFVDVTDNDLDDIACENSANNTNNQTKWALKTF